MHQGIYKGGRKFAFIALGPLGCAPGSRALNFQQGNKNGNCIEELNTLAKIHNSALAKMLKQLEQQLPGFKYSLFDFFKVATERIDNPSKYMSEDEDLLTCSCAADSGVSVSHQNGDVVNRIRHSWLGWVAVQRYAVLPYEFPHLHSRQRVTFSGYHIVYLYEDDLIESQLVALLESLRHVSSLCSLRTSHFPGLATAPLNLNQFQRHPTGACSYSISELT
ncbi:hypothetical protein RND71_028297 [Anisodus tanguticus]|uniref:Uncharacterized protein n=1 Tax=Anisodus tanguticus TaxID=243964 RepID=A0AAE1V918_9SOLA|nr:hypothetical protein RND71_028297 [Anisodus tanguticus]